MHKERLLKLADYLDQLSTLERWDFQEFARSEPACGTVGCAIGQFPFIWPEEFTLKPDTLYTFRVCRPSDVVEYRPLANFTGTLGWHRELAAEWFQINNCTVEGLFMSAGFYDKEPYNVTPADVAAMIRCYVEHHDFPTIKATDADI
jgi:hypothetical protein